MIESLITDLKKYMEDRDVKEQVPITVDELQYIFLHLDNLNIRNSLLGIEVAALRGVVKDLQTSEYCKEGETVKECLERNRRDLVNSMGREAELKKQLEERNKAFAFAMQMSGIYAKYIEEFLPGKADAIFEAVLEELGEEEGEI